MKIVFAGTPDIAATVLEKLLKTDHELAAVYTQPDRPKGRGRVLTPSPVKELALQHDIPVLQPTTLKTDEAQAELASLNADLMIVVAYGMILPQAILDTPARGCWNIHVSLLPRWRGAAPIQRAIEAGDDETGMSIMQMDAGLDTGDVLLTKKCDILPTDTSQRLHDRLADLGADGIVEALNQIDSLTPIKQPKTGVTYANKLTKEEGQIDWSLSAAEIDCKIRAFIPFPVATFMLNDEAIRVHQASINEKSGQPGEILDASKEGIVIGTGDKSIRLETLQFPGKKALSVADILNAKRDVFQRGQMISPSSSNNG